MSLLNGRAIRDWCMDKFFAKENMLNTEEEVTQNTEQGKSVDALVIKEVFQSVSDGKGLIASAITDKGVATDAKDTFQKMATNISKIESGGESGNFPISSPYHFVFSSYEIPFSTGAGNFTCPFAFNKLTKLIVTKVYMYLKKPSTSNGSGRIRIEIIGIREGEESLTVIEYWGDSLSATETSEVVINITTETEIDLSGYKSIEGIRILKYGVSGTVVQVAATIKFEADLYF